MKLVLSFLGRKNKKFLALIFIGGGILLASPPFINLLPDDIINIWIAKWITEKTGISMLNALIFSYTILAWSIILIGFYIFPYNTGRLINGFFNKIKNGIRIYINKVKRQPIYLIGIGIMVFIFYKVYLFYASKVMF